MPSSDQINLEFNFSGANGFLLVYDITNPESFDNISKWLGNINKNATEDVERMLIGKSTDKDVLNTVFNSTI